MHEGACQTVEYRYINDCMHDTVPVPVYRCTHGRWALQYYTLNVTQYAVSVYGASMHTGSVTMMDRF